MREHAITEETFFAQSVPMLYNKEQVPLQECLEMAVRRVGGWCEMAAACEGMSPGAEERPLLEAVTKQFSEDPDSEH
jgi:hypothetical protein